MDTQREARAAGIAAAYLTNNLVQPDAVPNVIHSIYNAVKQAETGVALPDAEAPVEPQKPAVSVKKSITPDYLICLEDGRKFKSLKRHLRTRYGMSPEDYRAKWGLPRDYPMAAPGYSQQRSELAKKMGLGHGGRTPPKATKKRAGGR